MELSEMIKCKQEREYSLKYISDQSGIPVVTLQKIFAGKTKHPRMSTMQVLSGVFDSGTTVTCKIKPEKNRYVSYKEDKAICDYIFYKFYKFLYENPDMGKVYSGGIAFMDEYPDIQLFKQQEDVPCMVLEILSDHKCGENMVKYKKMGVKEYWVLDPKQKKICVYNLTEHLFPNVYSLSEDIPCRLLGNDFRI